MLDDSQAALRTCAEGLKLDPEDAELWFRKAVVHRHRGESSEAEACWRRILGLRRPEQFSSVDQGIYGHLTRATWPSWPPNAAIAPRPSGCGARCSPNARATASAGVAGAIAGVRKEQE